MASELFIVNEVLKNMFLLLGEIILRIDPDQGNICIFFFFPAAELVKHVLPAH